MTAAAYSPAVPAKENIAWIDSLRVLACFMVVFAHCCDGFVAQFDADRQSFLTGVFLGSLMRPSVPLFVMITGALLLPLPADTTLGKFYSKRLGRLLWPVVFWSIALPLVSYLYFTGAGTHSVNPSVDLSAYTPEGLTNRLWTWVLNFNFDTTPLWYLYMLIGLYLIMPVVGAWLRSATRSDVALFLKVWMSSLFIPYIQLFAPDCGYLGNYGNMGILGECDWNGFSAFYYVSGFIGYIVLAYYLKRWPLQWSAKRVATVGTLMFLGGYAATAFGYVALQNLYPGNYAYLEIVWLFTGVNVFCMTVPVYVAISRMRFRPSPFLQKLAGLTFGIYLCHFFMVMIAYDTFNIPSLPYIIRIILMACTVFLCAALLTFALKSFRLTRPLVS